MAERKMTDVVHFAPVLRLCTLHRMSVLLALPHCTMHVCMDTLISQNISSQTATVTHNAFPSKGGRLGIVRHSGGRGNP